MAKHTLEELKQWQALPLNVKILMTKDRIRQWVKEYGEDGVYISFSGGKDSTVLLDIVRQDYPNVPAVFVDTGLEYPEIREFVKTFDNVEWIRPEMNFKKVIETYGYPFISKEICESISGAKRYYNSPDDGRIYRNGEPIRVLKLKGILPHKEKGKLSGEYSKRYDESNYAFLLNAPFSISNKCCNIMKKNPSHWYSRYTGTHPFTGQMACESRLRTTKWIQYGCNGFDLKEPISNPMAFWTDQDVLQYLNDYLQKPLVKAWKNVCNRKRKVRRQSRKYLRKCNYRNKAFCPIYGEIVEDRTGTDEVEGQLTISDVWQGSKEYDAKRLPLKTTGCDRTGCMFCGYGCHLEKEGEGRFERMKETHPKQYEYIMKPWREGGLGYKEVIDWINEHGNMNIRY